MCKAVSDSDRYSPILNKDTLLSFNMAAYGIPCVFGLDIISANVTTLWVFVGSIFVFFDRTQ